MLTREAELSILYEISSIPMRLRDRQQILDLALDKATRILGAEVTLIYLWDANDGEFRVCASQGLRITKVRQSLSLVTQTVDLRNRTLNWSEGEPFPFIDDPLLDFYPVKAAIGIPMRGISEVVGWLYAARLNSMPFSKTEESLFNVLCSRIADALEMVYAREIIQQRTVALETLYRSADKARLVAEEANILKNSFLANMSHELRTPLNAIINYTHFLAHPAPGDDPADQYMYLERVRTNADHLLSLINDVLDLSKIEAGQMMVVPEAIVLPTLLQSVATTAQSLLRDKPVCLLLEVDPDLPIITVDKTRIRQVLLNLLSNAAKFTEQGSITLRAALSATHIELAVIDTGIGIPPEAHERVFESFQQVDHALNRTYAGTGLGLPISRRLVELHGGKLTLESTVGVGSVFTIHLPLTPPELLALQDLKSSSTRGIAPPRVLVIADKPNTHTILQRTFRKAGFVAVSIDSSGVVLPTLQQQRPDLIIFDIRMPHLDGWAILRQIRALPQFQGLPVVLCSIQDADPTALGLLGIADYLVKPIRSEDILAAVFHWITPAQTVLVIDDDPDLRAITSVVLAQADLHVVCAATGAEGLRLASLDPPGLIMLDFMLPEMDGFEIIMALQANQTLASIPLIVMTDKDLSITEQRWLRTRAVTTLQKTQVQLVDLPAYLHTLLLQKGT